MTKLILISLLTIASSMSLIAQNGEVDSTNYFNSTRIGLSFSTLSGYGFNFDFPIDDRSHMVISGVFIYFEGNTSKDLRSSIGFEYQYDVLTKEMGRVFAGFGTGVYFENIDYTNESEFDFLREEDKNDRSFRIGGVLGFQTSQNNAVSIAYTISYYAILRGQVSYVGIGAGISLSFSLDRKSK